MVLLGGGQGPLWVLGVTGGEGRPGYKKSVRALSLALGTTLVPGQRLLKKQSSLRLGQA